MKRMFSRQTMWGKERRKEREEEGLRGDEGCFYDITQKVFHMRSAYEHSSHQLMPGRQRETSENPPDVKALTHADYSCGHPPLSLITGCQGEHSPHMWVCLVVWKIHMLLIKRKSTLLAGFRCGLLHVMSDQIETDPSRLKIDQQTNRELRKHMGDRHGHRYSVLYITACLHWCSVSWRYDCML